MICNKADGKVVEFPSNEAPQVSQDAEPFAKTKVEAVAREYGMLLTTQLESQRQYFHDQLAQKDIEVVKHIEKVEKEKHHLQQEVDALSKEKKNVEKKYQQVMI